MSFGLFLPFDMEDPNLGLGRRHSLAKAWMAASIGLLQSMGPLPKVRSMQRRHGLLTLLPHNMHLGPLGQPLEIFSKNTWASTGVTIFRISAIFMPQEGDSLTHWNNLHVPEG